MSTKKLLIIAGSILSVSLTFLFYPAAFVGTSACAHQQAEVYHRPIPQYGDLYSFSKYNVPDTKSPNSANLTVIITVPEYKDTATQEYAGGAKVSAGGPMTNDMRKVFQSFAGSMGEDIQSQLVAKGMTTKGPFPLSEVTYPDKKGSDLTLSIGVIFDIHYDNPMAKGRDLFSGNIYGNVYQSTMTVGMKVYFYMLEPMTEEKMWIKKLDLGVQDFKYEYALGQEQYVSSRRSDGCGGYYNVYDWRDKGMLYDERPKIFSDILKNAYPQVMKSAWTYLYAEEMQDLKMKSQEIRDKKRYTK